MSEKQDEISGLLKNLRLAFRDSFRDPNVSSKRLHVNLSNPMGQGATRIMVRKHWGGIDVVKKTLNEFWNSLGEASDVFYDEDMSFSFVSFPTHNDAAEALKIINHQVKAAEMIRAVVNAHRNDTESEKKATEQILVHFIMQPSLFGSMRASWAKSRRSFDEYYKYDTYEASEYDVDDCPDGEDRFVWDSYCAGRD